MALLEITKVGAKERRAALERAVRSQRPSLRHGLYSQTVEVSGEQIRGNEISVGSLRDCASDSAWTVVSV